MQQPTALSPAGDEAGVLRPRASLVLLARAFEKWTLVAAAVVLVDTWCPGRRNHLAFVPHPGPHALHGQGDVDRRAPCSLGRGSWSDRADRLFISRSVSRTSRPRGT